MHDASGVFWETNAAKIQDVPMTLFFGCSFVGRPRSLGTFKVLVATRCL